MSGQVINSGRSRSNRVEKVDKGGKGPAARLSNRCDLDNCYFDSKMKKAVYIRVGVWRAFDQTDVCIPNSGTR